MRYKKICVVILCTCLVQGCGEMKNDIKILDTVEEISADDLFNTKSIDVQDTKPLDMNNKYDSLNVATYLTKIGDTYFIADCYHDQILYNDNLTDPVKDWKVLTNEVHYAHTIAGDGKTIVIDDTENNRVLCFEKTQNGYVHMQTIEGIGMKPHYVQYDSQKDAFLVWSSITGEMYYIKRETDTNHLYVENVIKIDELYGVYVRSFTIMEDGIYFVSGHNNSKIIKADKDTLQVKERYEVAPEISGMVQITKIQDYYYITVSTDNNENQDYATIIRTKSLESLKEGDYEDVYDYFGVTGGTPYYITLIDGLYYMTHHRTNENIIAFDVRDNEICNVECIY